MPLQASDYNNIGWQWLQSKQDRTFAAELLEKSVSLDPNEVRTWKNLQCCYDSDQTLAQAIAVSERALKYHPHDPGVFDNLTQGMLRSGQLSRFVDLVLQRTVTSVGGALSEQQRQDLRRELMSSNPVLANLPEFEKLFQARLRAQTSASELK